jgi:fructose 1,6-bisphosphate aldolase/phosphatase
MELTLSVIKADIGGYVGHSSSHPDVIQKAKEKLARIARKSTS